MTALVLPSQPLSTLRLTIIDGVAALPPLLSRLRLRKKEARIFAIACLCSIALSLLPSHDNEPGCHTKDPDLQTPQPFTKTIVVTPGTVDLFNKCPGDYKYSIGD